MDHLHRPASAPPRATVLAVGMATVVAVACTSAVVVMRAANAGQEPAGHNWWLVAWLVMALAGGGAGAALVTRPGWRVVGTCLVVVGAASAVAALAVQHAAYTAGGGAPIAWLDDAEPWAQTLAEGTLAAVVPWAMWSGRGRAWTVAVAVAASTVAASTVAAADASAGALTVTSWTVVAVATAGAAALGQAARRSGAGRDPLPAWLFAGAVAAWAVVVTTALEVDDLVLSGRHVLQPLLLLATVPLLVVGIVLAAERAAPPGRPVLPHAVAEWVVLAAGIVVVYSGLVAGLGRLVGGSGPTWLLVGATGAIAVALEPARRRIHRLVDQAVYGARDDPLTVVQRILDQLGTDASDGLLPALVTSLRHELRLDAVAIDLRTADGWQRAGAAGPSTAHRAEVPLRHRGEVVGRLVVGWERSPSLRRRDREVIDQLTGPLGLAVGWVRLADDLRRSSLAIVSAREEERRRLRRDLHDGLGPALTGISLGLRTAMVQLDRAPGVEPTSPARVLLDRVADEVDTVVVELKQIVRDLRPTALDQLGLVGAVAEFTRAFDRDLEFHLALPSGPVELPAAVEVATYRIVTEAVTNVVRHANAARCWLTIAAGASVEIDVVDDGVGFDTAGSAGVGLTAMRERASELGGTVRWEPNPPHGTRLHVQLPAALP